MALEEEWVVSILQVFLEIMPGMYAGQDGTEYVLMVGEKLVEGVGFKLLAGLESDIFTEREAMQYVYTADGGKFCGVFSVARIDRRGSIDDAQVGILVVDLTELLTPIGQFESLVNEQALTSVCHESSGKFHYAMCLEIEVVDVDIQTLVEIDVKVFFGILQ